MTVPLSERGQPAINASVCIGCGQCVTICPDQVIALKDGKAVPGAGIFLGCIACGHCTTVCPTGAVRVSGRGMLPSDLQPIPDIPRPPHAALQSLMVTRRSTRRFTDTEIPRDVVEKILASATTAPMGIPPSDVGILVLHGRDKVQEFAQIACDGFEKAAPFMSAPALLLMRPFVKRATYEAFRDFVAPLMRMLPAERRAGRDHFMYNAPLALLFHHGAGADPADGPIAATYAMLAAESLGLGSCLIGTTVGLGYNGAFRKRYALAKDRAIGLGLIVGYPKVRWRQTLKRRFERVTWA